MRISHLGSVLLLLALDVSSALSEEEDNWGRSRLRSLLVQCRAKNGHEHIDPSLFSSHSSPLQWESLSAYCNVQCGPGSSASSLGCEHCECDGPVVTSSSLSRRLLFSPSSSLPFLTCNGVEGEIDLAGKDPTGPFTFSSSALIKAKVEALQKGEEAILSGCRVGASSSVVSFRNFDGQSPTSSGPLSSASSGRVPSYVRFKAGRLSSEVQERVAKLVGGSYNLRWVTTAEGLYEVPLSPDETEQLLEMAEVAYVLPKPSLFKISPSLLEKLQNSQIEELPVLELFFEKQEEETIERVWKELERQIREEFGVSSLLFEDRGRYYVEPLHNAAYFAELLHLFGSTPEILAVQERPVFSIDMPAQGLVSYSSQEVAAGLSPSSSSRSLSLWRGRTHRRLDAGTNKILGVTAIRQLYGLNGSGITAMCADTGVYLFHEQFRARNNETVPMQPEYDANQRKIVMYHKYSGNAVDEADKDNGCGHGTHVCGILGGSSANPAFTDVGTAPGVKMIIMDVGGKKDGEVVIQVPSKMEDLFEPSYAKGVRVFSFSWGTLSREYDLQASQFDAYLSKFPDIIVFTAVGNNGDGLRNPGIKFNCKGGLTTSPAMSKNVIAVGASVSTYESFNYKAQTCTEYNEKNLASFSSRGPAPDGRRRPEIICPGFIIESAKSLDQDALAKKTITAETCTSQGTSQSTPSCAGAGVLLYQWLTEGRYGNGQPNEKLAMKPPSFLIKSLLIFSATPLILWLPDAGQVSNCSSLRSQAKQLYYGDNIQGFGVVNLKNIMPTESGAKFPFFVPNNADALYNNVEVKSGQVDEYTFKGVSCNQAFKAVLAWNDPPASGNAAGGCNLQLVNDLDLLVIEMLPGGKNKTYFPVGTNNTKDTVNNAEVVLVRNASNSCPEGGRTFIVQVSGTKINAGPVQPYSLVAEGLPDVYTATAILDDTGGDSGFWKPWMTYTAVSIGGLVVIVILGLLVYTRIRNKRLKEQALNTAIHRASVMGRMSLNPRPSQMQRPSLGGTSRDSRTSRMSGSTTGRLSYTTGGRIPAATTPLAAQSRPSPLIYSRPSINAGQIGGERLSHQVAVHDLPVAGGGRQSRTGSDFELDITGAYVPGTMLFNPVTPQYDGAGGGGAAAGGRYTSGGGRQSVRGSRVYGDIVDGRRSMLDGHGKGNRHSLFN